MTIGFSGSQSGMNNTQIEKVREIIDHLDPDEVHHGDCIGSDKEFHYMFIDYHLQKCTKIRKIVIHPPTNNGKSAFTWMIDQYPQSLKDEIQRAKYKLLFETRMPDAYLIRNQHIVNEIAEQGGQLIATPKEIEHTLRSGTWTTIRYGWHKKIMVHVVPPIIIELNSQKS